MDFVYIFLRVACPMEMTINVWRHCEVVKAPRLRYRYKSGHLLQQFVPFMRVLLTVHVQSVSVEAPKEMRMLFKELRVGALLEVELASIRRIVVPEALMPSEIREPWVLAHPCACANDQDLCLSDEPCCLLYHQTESNLNSIVNLNLAMRLWVMAPSNEL